MDGWKAKGLGMVAIAAALGAGAAQAADVAVAGLFPGRAVLVVDGGAPQTVRVGGRTREGIVLKAASAEAATLEHDGRVFVARLGEQVASSAGTAASEISLQADGGGHFFTSARINGVAVNALVDTGATLVSMGRNEAVRLGIDYRSGTMGRSATANGLATIWKVRLDAVELDGVRLLGVDAAVHETDLPVVLLGMSFLNRMDWRREGDRLLLKKRY
ncbi:TIGR02281 family clan AA aspartic protease [Thauera sp.]|jgi:aspartyl protease family protein|uniref:retropepsin-like aspartic protease family protein n=1 Tax=Thauera sp. TaxID=1905334 RepID=UPI001A5A2928|nr:TIGR02281 family clan AA aspartic protease [Thauera sp.]MBL8463966.1 TIGR02281 family clan AA aspartic protease [Thauera sp.]HRO34542.1 TIGR02281 family clan AA aspartic protease [Thauera sp.]